MRRVYAILAAGLVLTVVAQFFLAASAAFDTAPNDESFQPHRTLGYGMVGLAIVVTIVGALARMPGRLIGMTGLIAGLGIGQGLIRAVAAALNDSGDTSTTAGTLVFGLHAVNALFILSLAGTVARRARALATSAAADRPTASTGALGPTAGPAQSAR